MAGEIFSLRLEQYVIAIVGLWLFDRVVLTWLIGSHLLKKPPFFINGISDLEIVDGGYARFAIDYISKSRFSDAVVSYELWNKNDPRVSITVKDRPLCYDKVKGGSQREYLPIESMFLESGSWIVRVRVKSTKHTFNPFHKIYPCVFEFKKEVNVKL